MLYWNCNSKLKTMKSKIAMGITTCDKISVAKEIVVALLEDELIACGQIEDPITSMFCKLLIISSKQKSF